ncbi:MAG TPA: hypothetical protein VM578_07980 [Candidatus Saccharimonadales bacterium]|nr:hypothetical protein [Candidatus Saccharimonadales bacterium]
MGPKCETCGTVNPAINRYCGQCGRILVRAAVTDAPEEFWREPEYEHRQHTEAAANLPPEVIDYDNGIPLFAAEGTDRRIHTPPEVIEKAHENLEREAELHNYAEHGGETHYETREREEVERENLEQTRGEFLRWDLAKRVPDPGDDNAAVGYISQPAASEPVTTGKFLHDGERTARTGVSGPSFLGLTDDDVVIDDEPEPQSHFARNTALAILAVVAILAALEWRSIRDYGLAYVQNGSMQVARRDKSTPKNPPAVAADNTGRELGLSSTPAKPGSPQPTESSPNADHPLPVQQAARSTQPTASSSIAAHTSSATPSNSPTSNAASAPSDSITSASAANHSTQPPAMSAPDVPEHESRSVAAAPPTKLRQFAKSPSTKSAASSDRARRSSGNAAASKPVPGADEMSRASRASDSEARAAWLWKAVGKGNPQAPVELARMYQRGTGVVRSCDQAQLLLRSAASKGNEQARSDLQQIRLHGCR